MDFLDERVHFDTLFTVQFVESNALLKRPEACALCMVTVLSLKELFKSVLPSLKTGSRI